MLNPMNKQSLLLLVLLSFSYYASAQTTGDYRSNAATFNWDVDASWQRWNGAAWVAPTAAQGYPGETAASIAGTVTIQNGHTVRANVDVTTFDIGNLVLAGSAVLNYNTNNVDIQATGNLTMDGTSEIQGTSTNRTLRIAGTFSVPVTATNARIQVINLTVIGATTIAGTLTLNTTGIVMNSGNLNLVGAGIFNLNAGTQDVNITGNLSMDGTSQIQGSSSTRTIDVSGTFTVPLTATNARIAGVSLTVVGATSVLGTVVFNSNTGIKTFSGRVTVSGSWTSTAITTNNRLVFGGEVITSGVFACGCN